MKTPLKISILLNLGMLAGLIFLLVARPTREAVRLPSPVVDNSPPENMPVTPSSPVPTEPPHFRWNQLDAKDYHVYVKNLRAIGCPEPTLRAIVRADVHAAFSYCGREMSEQLARLEAAPWPTQFANLQSEESLKSRIQELPGEETSKINDFLGLSSAPPVAVASLASAAQTSAGGDPLPATNRQRDPMVALNESAQANESSVSAADASNPMANAAALPMGDFPLPPAPALAAVPLVFQPADPVAANLSPGQMQVVNDLRQEFAATLNGTSRNPEDPAYQQAWQQALSQSDRLLEANLGQIAFNRYWDAQWDAQHPTTLAQ